MAKSSKAHTGNGELRQKKIEPKEPNTELPFLKKVQVIMGFDMDRDIGAIEDIDYNGAFRLGHHISGLSKARILQFLETEGVTPLDGQDKPVRLSAEDYYKLEDKYHMPPEKKDLDGLARRLEGQEHSVEVSNVNSGFGFNYSRVLKLLRDHGIEGTCMMRERKNSTGDLNDSCLIVLSDEGYQKFHETFPEILGVEAERKRVYDRQVAERTGNLKT